MPQRNEESERKLRRDIQVIQFEIINWNRFQEKSLFANTLIT